MSYVNNYLDSLMGNPPKDEEEAKNRLKDIIFLKREMDRMNFRNPRASIKELMSLLDLSELDAEERREVGRLIRLLRYAYNLRTWTYLRARAAYLAHRSALHILKFPFYPELWENLPYGGEYRAFLEPFGAVGFLVAREIMDEVPIKNRFVRYVVAATIVRSALKMGWEKIIQQERDQIKGYDRVLEYEKIVVKYDLQKARENPEILFRLLDELEEKGFLKNGEVDPEIIEGLRRRRIIRLREGKRYASGLLRAVLLRFYVAVPVRSRRTLPLFPGLPEKYDDSLIKDASLVYNVLGIEGLNTFLEMKGMPVRGEERLKERVMEILEGKARRFMEALK